MVNEEQQYQPDPLTAPVVREIFERYAAGDSVADIRESLFQRGIKTKTGGSQLNFYSIRNMLQKRKYLGEYRYGERIVPDAYPAVVTQELFDRAQQRPEKNKHAPAAAKAKEDYLLTTKLYCGRCATFMVSESGTSKTLRKYNYYKCLSNKIGDGSYEYYRFHFVCHLSPCLGKYATERQVGQFQCVDYLDKDSLV